jgi:hypothetical protein
MATQKVGGVIALYVDGVKIRCKSGAEYSLGVPELTPVVGADEKHGDKETPQPPMIKVTTTDAADVDIKALLTKRDATVILELLHFAGRTAHHGRGRSAVEYLRGARRADLVRCKKKAHNLQA